MNIPKQGGGVNFTGTGDLFASLFLAHSTLAPTLKEAFENTIATLQSVIGNTIRMMSDGVTRQLPVESRYRELKIVQSIREIERPNVKLMAVDVASAQSGDTNERYQNV